MSSRLNGTLVIFKNEMKNLAQKLSWARLDI